MSELDQWKQEARREALRANRAEDRFLVEKERAENYREVAMAFIKMPRNLAHD